MAPKNLWGLPCQHFSYRTHAIPITQTTLSKCTEYQQKSTWGKSSIVNRFSLLKNDWKDQTTMTTDLEAAADARPVCICIRSHCWVCFISTSTLLQSPAAELDAVSTFSLSADWRRFFFFFPFCGTLTDADSLTTDAVSVDVFDDLVIANEHSQYHRAR